MKLASMDFRVLVEQSPQLVVVTDEAGRISYANGAAREFFGSAAEGEDFTAACVHEGDRDGVVRALQARQGGSVPGDLFAKLRRDEGGWPLAELRVRPVSGEESGGHVVYANVASFDDLVRTHDPLTQLPNRAAFMDRLDRSLARVHQNTDYRFAILVIDLDHFSLINNSLGSKGGDQLLVSTAERLAKCLRPGDMVARIGGDQFAILADHLRSASDVSVDVSRVAERIQHDAVSPSSEETRELLDSATRVAERIQHDALGKPFQVEAQEVFASASIGITASVTGYERATDMVRDADVAMHRAKTAGGGRYELFDRAMHERARQRLTIETELRRALEGRQFRLHYQPIVRLDDLELAGFECLLRWDHPEQGLLPPAAFLHVVEEMGLLFQINAWLLGEACDLAQRWRQQHPTREPLSMAVNFSSVSFESGDFVRCISDALDASGLEPRLLTLELTESLMLKDFEKAVSVLEALRDLGVEVHLDDFGTGYSSLSYIHRLPIHAIKIDQSFTQRLGLEKSAEKLVRTLVELGHSLDRIVVAEGIETRDQLQRIKELGCDLGQGYYFASPLDSKDAEALLEGKPPWT